jgi:hypothetical protein
MKRFGKARTARIKAERKARREMTERDRVEVSKFQEFLGDYYRLTNAELVAKYGAEYLGLKGAELDEFEKQEGSRRKPKS